MTKPAIQPPAPPSLLLWQPPSAQDSLLAAFARFTARARARGFDPVSMLRSAVRVFIGAGAAPVDFQSVYRWSVEQPEAFWSALWDFAGVIGEKGPTVIHKTPGVPWARFFTDSRISYAENMLARAGEAPGDPAIIYRLQGEADRVLSWKELSDAVSIWQQALERAGVRENDRVAVYLSNVPETVIVLLACSNIGAVFSSAGMEMGPDDLINRFAQVRPKILVTAESYVHGAKHISRLHVIEKVQHEITSIERVVIVPSAGAADLKPADSARIGALQGAVAAKDFLGGLQARPIAFTRRDFNHPLYILFSSGSTGKPKCFEHSTGGVFLKHVCEYMLNSDVRPGDRVFYHATPSWMMWNWLASGLAMKATILMYDGSPAYPDANAQWAFTSAHGCTHHGTAAPVILSWESAGLEPGRDFNLKPLRMVLSTGAVLPPQGFEYIHRHVKTNVKISSISGGTDVVGCFLGGNPLMPTYAGQINGPMLGMDVRVLDDSGNECAPGQAGELVCVNPFPSMPLRFLDDPDGARYREAYFDHYDAKASRGRHLWRHGDTIEKTAEGQYIIIGRSDATLNQNGVRIGTGVIYEQLVPFRDRVRDYAAIDFTRPDNKQAITVLFLGMDTKDVPEDLAQAIRLAVKNNVGPYSVPTELIAVPGVLKTPNGKIAEVVMKKILAGKPVPNPSLYGAELVQHFEKIGRDLTAKYGG